MKRLSPGPTMAQPGTHRRLCAHHLGATCGSHAVRGQSLLGANPALLPTRQTMACPNPYPQCPHSGSLAAASHQAASPPTPALARHCCAPTHGSSSSSQSEFWPTAGLQSSLPEPRALLLTARLQLPPGLEMGREPLWTRAQGHWGELGWGGGPAPFLPLNVSGLSLICGLFPGKPLSRAHWATGGPCQGCPSTFTLHHSCSAACFWPAQDRAQLPAQCGPV